MILSLTDIAGVLKENPMQSTLDDARAQATLLNMHITGEGLKDQVASMDYFEDQQKKNLRQKYARSNKDIMGRLHRPIDKIFRAKGGSIVYDMDQSKIQDFAGYLNDIRNGQSLRKWIQMVALPAFQIDPMGLIFVENEEKRDQKGMLQPYPTYKSTKDIFSYKLNGRKLEWVIFNVDIQAAYTFLNTGAAPDNSTSANVIDNARLQQMKDGKAMWFRVIDDKQDRLIKYNNSTVTEVVDQTLPNYFETVPALIISDIVSFNKQMFLSPDDLVVELMNDYLTDCSVFNIWKKLYGFPKQWRIRSLCSSCQGHGKVQGKECPDCDATGYAKTATPRDETIVPMPEDGGKLPNAFAGYVTPDIEGAGMMTSEMDRLFHMAFETLWGSHPNQKTGGPSPDKSATEAVMDVQSMNERLHDFREWGQGVETFIIDLCGEVMYEGSYKGVSNNWGNRFIVEGPDVIYDKYSNARSKGAPQATLDGLLRDYYESYYANDNVNLQKSLKLMQVEPWTHLTIQQVQLLSAATQQDKLMKTYFSEWRSTVDDMDIIHNTPEKLRALLLAYCNDKMVALQAEQAAAAAALQSAMTETDDDGAGIKQKTGMATA